MARKLVKQENPGEPVPGAFPGPVPAGVRISEGGQEAISKRLVVGLCGAEPEGLWGAEDIALAFWAEPEGQERRGEGVRGRVARHDDRPRAHR